MGKSKERKIKNRLKNQNKQKEKMKAIYKTRNTRTGSGMRGMQGTLGMSTGIPGNLL